jgi:mRNA interferase MazF
VVTRGDVVWAELGPPAGRRPVCVFTRAAAIPVLNAVTCAPVTRTMRGIPSEVTVGRREGLPAKSVINCDGLITVPLESFDDEPVGRLDLAGLAALDRALRYSLEVRF